jgi:PAS domain S-box-containing protein
MTMCTTEQQTRAALLDSQRRVLERIANGAPLREILETLVRLIEAQADGMRCAVLLVDAQQQRLRFAAAPSLPEDYKAGIAPFLRIAPGMGSCGTAAFLRKPVYTQDTETDTLWKDCSEVAVRNGLRAIWSTPILSDDNAALGTFAMYYGEPRLPSSEHIQLIDMATQMARVAIEAKGSEELLRTVFECAPGGMGITDLAGNIIRVNPAFERLIGYTEVELRGKSIADITHDDDYPRSKAPIDELLAGKRQHFVIDKRYYRKDGEIIWVHITVALLRGPAEEPRYLTALVEDITECKRAGDALQRSAAELQALSRRLVELQESERRDLSRELHDRVGQNLTALKINLDMLQTALASHGNEVRSRVHDSAALLESTMDMIGNVMSELRPPMLDEHGLAAALDWHARSFSSRTGIAVEVRGSGPAMRLAPEVEIALFRIAQEALNNVAKHARAHRVEIALDHANGECVMSVQDDGIGFDSVVNTSDKPKPGLGMVTMRERAQAVGGCFEVQALPGRGTQLTVRVSWLA